MRTTAPWPVPCSTEWRGPSPRSPPTGRTTETASTPASPRATPRRPWSCRRARPPCPAGRPRASRRGATAISGTSPSTGAWPGRQRPDTRDEPGPRPPSAVEAGDRRRGARACGPASGDRGGCRRPRPRPHVGVRTPELRPHRLTPDGVGVSAPAPLIRAPRCRERLLEGWTPEQVAGWLERGEEHGLRPVSLETIYAFIHRPP